MIENLAGFLREHMQAVLANRGAARRRAGARGPQPIDVPEGASMAPDLVDRVGAFNKAVDALAESTNQHDRDWLALADLFAAGGTLAAIRGRAAALRAEHCEFLRRELDLLDRERTLLGRMADSVTGPREMANGLRARALDIVSHHRPAVERELVEAFCAVLGVMPPRAMTSGRSVPAKRDEQRREALEVR